MIKEPQTASEAMMKNQMEASESAERANYPDCVLPDEHVQKLFSDILEQASFPGKMAEYIVGVKHLIKNAVIKNK